VQGDFGPSLKYKDFTVTELIAGGFPVSLRLGGIAVLIALVVGVGVGTLAALRQNTGTDYAAMGAAMTGIMVPNFVLAPLLTLVFGLWLSWLPVGGWGDGGVQYMILPIFALSLYQIGFIARLTRGSMIEVLRTNYVRTARAKGLPERIAITRHALKAGILPVVSYIGPAIINTITGSVIIEQIFGIPGIGRYFVQAALNRDYTLVMGVTVFYGVLIILANLAVDLIYGLLDPRIRYD
jgi:oligopeptide transport system permease protein